MKLTYKGNQVTGIEILTMFILNILLKLIVGVAAYYVLTWLFNGVDIKTLIIILVAIKIGSASNLEFKFR